MSDGGRPSNGILSAFGVILRCLEGLSSYNFRKFKNFMSNKDLDNPMGFGLLEEADQLKTARLLLSHYGEAEVVSVTCCVLRQHDLRSAAEELEKEWQKTRAAPLESLETCRERYMKSMRSKYLKMKEKNSNFQSFDLEKRYTKLLLVDKQPKKTEKKKLLTHTGSVHLETMRRLSSGETSTTIEDLFTQNGEEHRIVVLEGPAGIGKTMTINKMMLDWASGKLYQDKFNYLFCITSHKVNRITREMTLAEFIADTFLQECTSDEVEVILNHSEKVLFLVDGLDEFDQAFMTLQGGSSLKFTKESFLNCLLTKPLLRESSLIVTTRPFMLEKLSNYVEVPRYVEIMGLEDREEYFRNFFEDEEQAQDVLGLIKENETLFTLCAVPMTCWIICTVFKHQTKEGLDVQKYNTTTSIYTLYLKSLVRHQGKDLKSDISCHVKRLSALAKEGVWNQKVMFMEVDLERLGLVKSSDSLFLNENVFQRDIEEYTCYSFFHLSVQEFFAALYYLLHEETNDNQKVVHCKSQVRTLLEESEKRPHLASTIRFLFGLSKEKQIKEIENIIGCKIPSRPQSALEDWMKEKQHEPHHRTLMWSYETQDEVFVKKVMSCLPELKIEGLYFCFEESEKNLVDRSLSYCLVKSASNHIVNFYDHTMNPEAFNLLTEGLRKCSKLNFGKCWFPNGDISQLCHLKGKIEKLWLNWCYLMPSCRWHLRSVIVANTSLKQLDLSNNELHELGVKYLCEALTGKGPRLQELRLKSCGLNTLSCVNLAWVIKKGYLTKLDLSDNNLEDLDLPLDIFDELQDKDVRLALTDNKLEDHFSTEIDSIDDRLDVLNSLDRMKITLDLLLYLKDLKVMLSRSHDKKKLPGIKCLFDSLMHLDCALQELSLERCNLPSYVCKDLRSVITANRSLVKLDLSANNLNIRDMKHLCQGLQDPQCNLKDLRLWRCDLKAPFCKYLLPVTSLVKLDLSANKLKSSGVKHLCKGLQEPGCSLQELWLSDCGLTSSCCQDLLPVLITNQSLRKLDLTHNKLQESGVKCLYEGLQNPKCVLQELGLLKTFINVDEHRKNGLFSASQAPTGQVEGLYWQINDYGGDKDGPAADGQQPYLSAGMKEPTLPGSVSDLAGSTTLCPEEETARHSCEDGNQTHHVIDADNEPNADDVFVTEESLSQEENPLLVYFHNTSN